MNGSNPTSQPITAADIPLALKARYFASGLVVGVLVSEPIKKMVSKLTSQVEGLADKAGMSDMLAQAKDALGAKDVSVKKDDCCAEESGGDCHGNA